VLRDKYVRAVRPYSLGGNGLRSVTWHTLLFEKKKLGVVAHFREEMCKNHMRQNVGKEKQKSTCFGIFYNVQVMNFIPVKVSTLYIFLKYFMYVHYQTKVKQLQKRKGKNSIFYI
jgi:hypothetical protein